MVILQMQNILQMSENSDNAELQIPRGAVVVANSIDGPVERLVWEDHGDSVTICTRRQFEALARGWSAPMPIGFAKADITRVGSGG